MMMMMMMMNLEEREKRDICAEEDRMSFRVAQS